MASEPRRYRMETRLGEGGMGEVWKAFDTRLRRAVALKVIRPERGLSSATLLREARAGAALKHPNIVTIYDVGEEDGSAYIAMELLEGRTLRELVGDASIPLERRLGWLRDIARALDAAHEAGFVHRDVKPENVFVQRDGTVKVLDFGIAKRSEPDANTAPASDRFIGTPRYMSPEQALGTALDGRTDQYAWGLLAAELLTGRHPVDRATGKIALAEMPDVPERWQSAIRRAVKLHKEDRFRTMGELLAAIDGAPAPPVVTAEGPSGPPVETGSPTVTVAEPPVVPAPAPSPPRPRSRKRIVLVAAIAIAAVTVGLVSIERSRSRAVGGRPVEVHNVWLGREHTCAATRDRALYCWGDNRAGELGTGDGVDHARPALVPGLDNVVYMGLGAHHTCAVTATGRVFCWGGNARGQLGDGTTKDRATPAEVIGLGRAKRIQAGLEHTCAEIDDGSVACWGSNVAGEIGDGSAEDRRTPTRVPGLAGVKKLSSGGGRHTCAAVADGSVLCWGSNDQWQIGVREPGEVRVPTRVPGLSGIAKVWAGLAHSCALKADATVWCWGANESGQLGDGTKNRREAPAYVAAHVGSIGMGFRHTCVHVAPKREVSCWGANDVGQMGTGAPGKDALVPGLVPDLAAEDVVAKGEHTCSIDPAGALFCWGMNDRGQLGDGTTSSRARPAPVTW